MVDLAEAVSGALGVEVVSLARLGGGDVAQSYRATLADGRTVFTKTHHDPPPGFFTTEAAGLSWLREAGALPVPDVLAVSDQPALLVLEWIDEQRSVRVDDQQFGRDLARLHAAGAPSFGREDRRTTGSRGLPNEPCDTWAEFFASQRLQPLARLLDDRDLSSRLDRVAARLDALAGPAEPPARLHGDLWAGNRIVDIDGRSWLIDPACFGGHREFDLAMMRLFGGFADAAFQAYDEVSPLAPGWDERVALHHLAPLAVHLIKFGGSYLPALRRALESLGA